METDEYFEPLLTETNLIEANKRLTEWLIFYNFNRPHQALDYLTPFEYYQLQVKQKKLLPMYLTLSAGITRVENNVFYDSRRAYPSGGARYPSEIYIIIRKTYDLRPGLYHYHVRTHSLEFLWPINKTKIKQAFPSQKFVSESRAIIIITSAIERSVGKYGERAYRYSLIEAGHIAQNIYLISQAIKIGCCALGGFNDKKISELLDINIDEELPLYCIAIL